MAVKLGVPFSALAERLFLAVRSPVAEAALRTWADGFNAERARAAVPSGPSLKPSERTALAAVRDDWEPLRAILPRTGQSDGILWRALRQLEGRGLVERDRADPTTRALWQHVKFRRKPGAPAEG